MTASKKVLDVPLLLQMHVKHVKQVERRCMAIGKVPGIAALWTVMQRGKACLFSADLALTRRGPAERRWPIKCAAMAQARAAGLAGHAYSTYVW